MITINHIWLSSLLLTSCTFSSLKATERELQRDVSERVGVSADWYANEQSVEQIEAILSSKLSGEMTVDDAVAVSLLNNRSLSALYRQLGIAQTDLLTARLPENPAFSIERRFKGQAAEFDVTQEFLGLLLIPLRLRVAESQFKQTRLRLTQAILDHAAEVRAAYYRVQAQMQISEMRRSVATASEAAYQATLALRKAGNNTGLELAQQRRDANKAQLDLAEAELSLAESRESLNVLLGLWGEGTAWRLPAHLPDVPESASSFEAFEKKAISDRFDLASLRAEIVELAHSLEITNITSYIPMIELTGHSEREPDGAWTTGPSFGFSLPFFNFGGAARAQARYRLLEAQDRYAALAVEIRSQVRLAYMKMELARKRASFYRHDALPVQHTITRQTQLRYNGMFTGMFELLAAKQAEIDAGREYIEAVSDYWVARTQLEKVMGSRLSGDTV